MSEQDTTEAAADETVVEEPVEEIEEVDPLQEALQRAENAEKEITYRDA